MRGALAIMKRRGVKGLGSKPKKGTPARPLHVFAEGDSWFDYPVPLFGGGVIPGSRIGGGSRQTTSEEHPELVKEFDFTTTDQGLHRSYRLE